MLKKHEERLMKIVDGEVESRSPRDTADAGVLAHERGRHRRGLDLLRAAFTAEPELLADLPRRYRYWAARSAVQIGKDNAALRLQALGWLEEQASAWKQRSESEPYPWQTAETLSSWQEDDGFAKFRESVELDRLPTEERTRWQSLWQAMSALRTQISSKSRR